MAADDGIPGYWMNETSGLLRPAVKGFLEGRPLTEAEIALLRAYFQQWIGGPGTSRLSGHDFRGPEIEALRRSVDTLTTRRALAAWVRKAVEAGVDPL